MTLFILPTLIISRSSEMCDFNSTRRALIELTWSITSARGATGGGELSLRLSGEHFFRNHRSIMR